jgi:hypothetical protein
MTDWDSTFRAWSRPSSDTEAERCENTVTAVKRAIDEDPTLSRRDITVFAQGSYKNNTNVREESDVDICIRSNDPFFDNYEMAERLTRADTGVVASPYLFGEYKNDVEHALREYFGSSSVVRGDKAFDIHETSHRIMADGVACFEHRRYLPDRSYLSGTEFWTDRGGRIINWPEQQHANGVAKNIDTSHRYKLVVRVLKRIRYRMEDEGHPAAVGIPSFLIECLVWNVPSDLFNQLTLLSDVHDSVRFLAAATASNDACSNWGEVSGLKYLFHAVQPWTREQANAFVIAAGSFIELW